MAKLSDPWTSQWTRNNCTKTIIDKHLNKIYIYKAAPPRHLKNCKLKF